MAKKIESYLKLQIPAAKATPSPPVGPALGQRQINIMEFCKAFNERTSNFEQGMPCSTIITIYNDKSFSFKVKTAPVSYYLKKVAKVKSGSSNPGTKIVATITMNQCREIGKIKMPDLNANDIESAALIIAGSAYSMGFNVEGK